MTDEEVKVEAGVAWLNEHKPDWLDIVEVERLRMDSTCGCVLGQSFDLEFKADTENYYTWRTGYGYAFQKFDLESSVAKLGFSIEYEDDDEDASWDRLERTWVKKIRELRKARTEASK